MPAALRRLAIATAVVFAVSAVFPVVAGLSKRTDAFPRWWGPADVTLAIILGAMAVALISLANRRVRKADEEAAYRAYRALIWGIFAILVAFFLVGDRIVWPNCLTGIAWRSWLLLYGLPPWIAAIRADARP